MRVSMTQLREGGRLKLPADRKQLRGMLSTKRFQGGETWFKVLSFQETSCAPGQHELYDPRVKECLAEKPIIVFSGLAQESGAWVVQEWEVDVSPQAPESFVGRGWIKPERRYAPEDLPARGLPFSHAAEGPASNTSTGASRSSS